MKRIAKQVGEQRGGASRTLWPIVLVLVVLPLAALPAGAAELVDVRSAKHADFTRVVFETDGPIWYSLENRSREAGEIELIIPVQSTATTIQDLDLPARGVALETLPDNSGSRALLQVDGPLDIWTNQLKDPPRIVLDLRPADHASTAAKDLGAIDYETAPQGEATPATTAVPAASSAARDVSAGPTAKGSAWTRHPLFWVLAVCLAMGLLVFLYVRRVSQQEIVRRAPASRVQSSARPKTSHPGPRSFQVGRGVAEDAASKTTPPAKEALAPTAVAERAATEAAANEPQGETMVDLALDAKSAADADVLPDDGVAAVSATGASDSGGYREVLDLLRRLDDRLAALEGAFPKLRDEHAQIRERSLAQGEELRAHRAAMARLLRRPSSTQGSPRVGPSSS